MLCYNRADSSSSLLLFYLPTPRVLWRAALATTSWRGLRLARVRLRPPPEASGDLKATPGTRWLVGYNQAALDPRGSGL
eukprot:8263865-Pyramimonas_sp.AAC.1